MTQDVQNYDQVLLVSKEKLQSLCTASVSVEDIENIEEQGVKMVKPFVGTLKVHQYSWTRENGTQIQFNSLSCLDCEPDSPCDHYGIGKLSYGRINERKRKAKGPVKATPNGRKKKTKEPVEAIQDGPKFRKPPPEKNLMQYRRSSRYNIFWVKLCI